MKCFKYQVIALSLFAGAMITSSCDGGDDKTEEPTPPGAVNPETPSQSEAMTPIEQKKYLDEVATEFMSQLDSDDFKDLADFGEYVVNTYGEYDFDEVSEWAEGILDDMTEYLNHTSTETAWGDTYYYDNYKSIIMMSNFRSHFTAKNYSWVRTGAEDLQFIFKDSSMQECVLRLATSGAEKKVHVGNIEDWYDYEYDYTTGNYNEYFDRTYLTIGVPEKIELTLTRGSRTVLNTVINIDLASISGEEFDLSKSQLNMNMVTDLDNGYKFTVSQAAYTPAKVSASFAMSKNGSMLLNAIVSSDINDIPALTLGELSEDDESFENTNLTNVFVKLDILGKVQMQGTLSDVITYVSYMDEADENYDNESTFKSYINQANALTDINLFYDGSSTKQATIKFEAFVDWSYGGTTYWVAEPVINFYDGSSYSTFEAFFNDNDFKKTINSFENLIEAYENLIG